MGPIDSIRADHIRRYLFATGIFRNERVLDVACGCGYGSWLLHGAGNEVTGVDIAPEAIAYAKRYYQGPTYLCQRAEDTKGKWDALVSFETLEHLDDPVSLLRAIDAEALLASVPNENVTPFNPDKFSLDVYPHKRHYTPEQFRELIESGGYKVKEMFCQKNKTGEIVPGTDGMFLVVYASKG